MDERARAAWLSDFTAAAERFQDSDKWGALGQAVADQSDRLWLYPDLDTLVIALWPLVKAHNWTYRDLLSVMRPALERPDAYPCDSEQNFATYCINVLGLRKVGRGASARNGRADTKSRWSIVRRCEGTKGTGGTRKDKLTGSDCNCWQTTAGERRPCAEIRLASPPLAGETGRGRLTWACGWRY